MIVNINNSTYEMNSKQYKAVLDTAVTQRFMLTENGKRECIILISMLTARH